MLKMPVGSSSAKHCRFAYWNHCSKIQKTQHRPAGLHQRFLARTNSNSNGGAESRPAACGSASSMAGRNCWLAAPATQLPPPKRIPRREPSTTKPQRHEVLVGAVWVAGVVGRCMGPGASLTRLSLPRPGPNGAPPPRRCRRVARSDPHPPQQGI